MTPPEVDINRKINELSLLFEISRILDTSPDIRDVINTVLKSLADYMGMERGTVSLLNRQTGKITIEAAYKLTPAQIARGVYSPGEGITGKVVQSGKPMIIPDILKEPTFINKTGARRSLKDHPLSFICVPVRLGNETMGALSVDKRPSGDSPLEDDLRLLTITSSMIAQAVKLRRNFQEDRLTLLEENRRLQKELKDRYKPANIIGNSSVMEEVFELIAQVSRSDASVLILGESGTGKELVAREIHYNSLRADNPLIKVNCAALPESVIESELFGHEKGAFTGAITLRKGRFEMANGGTIFLDEIGDLTPAVQVKLLRVLQEREIERVGGNRPIHVNVRIITATNRNLEKEMTLGRFREDLYYRLNVFPIHIPPLRERKSDIMLLTDFFTEKYGRKNNKTIRRITSSAIDLLMIYHWPGNVRELENCIERAVLLSRDGVIHGYHLPPSLQSAESTNTGLHSSLQEAIDNLEKELILDVLKSSKGNIAKSARFLGISERIMGLRVKKYNVDYRHFRT